MGGDMGGEVRGRGMKQRQLAAATLLHYFDAGEATGAATGAEVGQSVQLLVQLLVRPHAQSLV